MTYNRRTWVDGTDGDTPIDAASLNNMEAGIAAAAETAYVDAADAALDARVDDAEALVAGLDGRVTTVEGQYTGVSTQVAGLDTAVSGLDGRVTATEGSLGGLGGRMDAAEAADAALDGRLDAVEPEIVGATTYSGGAGNGKIVRRDVNGDSGFRNVWINATPVDPDHAVRLDALQAAIARAAPRLYNVKDFGAVGDGVADDTAAINAATNAARMSGVRRGGTVFFPAGRYRITATINLYTAVSLLGEGWSLDTTFYNTSALVADPAFVGTAMVRQNPDGGTVSDPVTRPDQSWHWGTVSRMAFVGNGMTGPHGLDVGWAGEASSVSNCQFYACNRGLTVDTTTGGAVSLVCNTVSMFSCNYGLYVSGKVQVFSLSGDHNTSLLYVTGGRAANVNVFGMKAEAFVAGRHDPVVDVDNLDGGRVAIHGGWVDTDSAKSNGVVRLRKTTATNRPRIVITGLDANDLYTTILNDTIDSKTVPNSVDAVKSPSIFWNGPTVVGGQGNLLIANNSRVKYATDAGMTALAETDIGQNQASRFVATTTYTLQGGDNWRYGAVDLSNAAAVTVTVPTNATVPFPVGTQITLRQFGAGAVSVAGAGGVTVNTPPNASAITRGQWSEIRLTKRDTDHWVLSGDLRQIVPAMRRYLAANQTPANSTAVVLTLSSTDFTRGSGLTASGTDGIQVTEAGLYEISAGVSFTGGTSGTRNVQVAVNGTTVREFGGSGTDLRPSGAAILQLAANDVVRLSVFVTGSPTVSAAAAKDTGLTVTRLGA